MTLHALVESNMAAILLANVLREEQEAGFVEIRASVPRSSLYAAARTLLAVRCEPVALDDDDLMALRAEPPIRELLEFRDELRCGTATVTDSAGPSPIDLLLPCSVLARYLEPILPVAPYSVSAVKKIAFFSRAGSIRRCKTKT